MNDEYPRFSGIALAVCNPSAEAEIKFSKTLSVVPSVKINQNSFAMETRRYLCINEYKTGFTSVRISTRGNIGFGFGTRDINNREFEREFSFDPTFGLSIDKHGNASPFLSVMFSLNF
jgi:hypothetical protein